MKLKLNNLPMALFVVAAALGGCTNAKFVDGFPNSSSNQGVNQPAPVSFTQDAGAVFGNPRVTGASYQLNRGALGASLQGSVATGSHFIFAGGFSNGR